MKYKILFTLLAGWISDSQGQDHFSLRQSIDYTLKHHPSQTVYTNNIGIAEANSVQTMAGYLPQVSGSATFTDNLKLQTNVLPAGIFGPEPEEIQLGTKYNSNLGIDVSQTLYDPGKIAGIRGNKPYIAISRLQQEQNEEDIAYNTANAYFQVLIYEEQIAIQTANKIKYEEMVKTLQYQFEKGTVLEKDVDRVRVNLNAANYQLEDAKTRHHLAINTLKNAMGLPIDANLAIIDSINYEQFAERNEDDAFELGALTEVKIGEKSIELQQVNLLTKQAGYLPSVSFFSKIAAQSLANDFSDAFSSWKSFSYVGLSVSVPIFSGFRRQSQVKEERLKLENEKHNLQIREQSYNLRFENAKTSVGTAYGNYQSNKDNMALALKLRKVTEYQYQRGVATLTDFLNDDTAYKSAQSNYINSLYNLIVSQLEFQKSRGNLFPFLNSLQ
ncbi:outer membrane protein TolC [Algoriphagus sp. 4150]|uniref:TolC family protein n=1 Tax=Algoriphagus sp. 4150 TaxID=2817756 RepID=UPI0028571D75|nr:TolC family protein [Algoriphagus sp. 4150]MDR7128035.1 outer membrane protein TolC [Algoriphagus sp. 4150]